jgi:hypothetical protein
MFVSRIVFSPVASLFDSAPLNHNPRWRGLFYEDVQTRAIEPQLLRIRSGVFRAELRIFVGAMPTKNQPINNEAPAEMPHASRYDPLGVRERIMRGASARKRLAAPAAAQHAETRSHQ